MEAGYGDVTFSVDCIRVYNYLHQGGEVPVCTILGKHDLEKQFINTDWHARCAIGACGVTSLA